MVYTELVFQKMRLTPAYKLKKETASHFSHVYSEFISLEPIGHVPHTIFYEGSEILPEFTMVVSFANVTILVSSMTSRCRSFTKHKKP